MIDNKDFEIHFEYKLNDINFVCEYCKERIHIKESNIKADTYLCKCNHLYRIPIYYKNLYDTRELKEVIKSE